MLIGLVAVVASFGCNEQKKAAAEQPTPAVAAPVPAPTVTPDAAPVVVTPPPDAAPMVVASAVTATRLFDDYKANEVSADDKYKGKIVEVTGILKRVAKDADERPYAELVADRYEVNEVTAYFGVDTALLGKLKKGQKLEIRCLGAGLVLTSPLLKGCGVLHVYEWTNSK